jgi:hypothetical protein
MKCPWRTWTFDWLAPPTPKLWRRSWRRSTRLRRSRGGPTRCWPRSSS